jgi:TolB-like protein
MLKTLLLLTALSAAELTHARQPSPTGTAPKTLAVLYFDNRTGNPDYDALGKGMAAMMITDLAAVEDLQVVEREHLQELLKEMESQRSSYFDQSTAVKAGKVVGAQYILAGQIVAVKPRIRLDTRVVNVQTSETMKTAQVTGNEEKFFELQQKLAQTLIDGLALSLTPEGREQLQAQQEANRIDRMSTMVSLSQAISLFDRGEYVDAVSRMAPVMRSQPKSLVVQLTYEEIKRRAAAKTREKSKQKTRDFIRGILKPD